MEPALKVEYSPHGEYMFGLLGYSTWNIFDGRTFICQVTLNAVDRSVTFSTEAEPPAWAAYFADRTWSWWMKWLRRHRQDPF